MDDLKVGDYVRTNDGIFKVTKIDGLYIYLDKEYFDNQYQMMRDVTFKERIIKHSFNIIDLIEVGDIVNGYRIDERAEYDVLIHKARGINRSGFMIPVAQYNEDIKTILTHEQYERNCYKAKEK